MSPEEKAEFVRDVVLRIGRSADIHAIADAIRKAEDEALDRAAKVAEEYEGSDPRDYWASTNSARAIAVRIRSLKNRKDK